MHCPFCAHDDTRVVDSRIADDGESVRRRRECPACNQRFTTYERADLAFPMVVKADGRREPYRQEKLLAGLRRALSKRPVSTAQIDLALRKIEKQIRSHSEREISARRIGDLVMAALRELDPVAYVRFASVYRRFDDLHAFNSEIQALLDPDQAIESPNDER
ncbi:transcriptional regulator NrdR [Acidithiobacillus sp. IBUN Pt1247-S3]|uniref:transcriptional regulator NrdR n=1 Tax=Acidithiobacillus sp. IBUN Pt1247-S3 TaxID=3166642 RepID=UPI0034E45675